MVGWLVMFNVPSTARSFRDGTPIYCPLRRTWSSINTPFRPGIEPWAMAWQSITLPLHYASSTYIDGVLTKNERYFDSLITPSKTTKINHKLRKLRETGSRVLNFY